METQMASAEGLLYMKTRVPKCCLCTVVKKTKFRQSITSASAISTRLSCENEVEERFNAEKAKDSIDRIVRGNEGGIDLLVGESLLKRQQDDPDVAVIVRGRLVTDPDSRRTKDRIRNYEEVSNEVGEF